MHLLSLPLLHFLLSQLGIVVLRDLFTVQNRGLVVCQGLETKLYTNLVRLFQTNTLFHRHFGEMVVVVRTVTCRDSDNSDSEATSESEPFQVRLWEMASLAGPFRRTYQYLASTDHIILLTGSH